MGIGLIFFQKKFRSGQAEFIDTLLHISHHETVIAALLLAGHRPEQIFLYQIAVLVFINEYLLKIFPVLPGHGTGPNLPLFLPQQYLQGIVLDIRKIHQLFFLFPCPERLPKFYGQFCQYLHRLPAGFHLSQTERHGRGKKLFPQFLQSVLDPAPQALYQFPLVRGYSRIFFSRQPPKADACQLLCQVLHDTAPSVPAFLRPRSTFLSLLSLLPHRRPGGAKQKIHFFQQAQQHLPLLLHHGRIHIGAVRLLADLQCLPQGIPTALEHLYQILPQILSTGRLLPASLVRDHIVAFSLFQPLLRPGAALRVFVKF